MFTGGGTSSTLTLDGLLVSGGDIVLRGAFDTVRLTACTTDPGTLNEAGDALATSVDGRPLAPVTIWIEADPDAAAGAPGAIAKLNVDHCVLGPIRTRNGGAVEQVTISDSIVQGIAPVTGMTALIGSDVYDPELLAKALGSDDPLSKLLLAGMPASARNAVNSYSGGPLSAAALGAIVAGLNSLVAGGTSIYDAAAFLGIPLPPDVLALLAEGAAADVAALNRGLLEAAYPVALSAARSRSPRGR